MYKLPKGTTILRCSSRRFGVNFEWSLFVTNRDAYYHGDELRVDHGRYHLDIRGECYVIIHIPLTNGYDQIRVNKKYLDYVQTS